MKPSPRRRLTLTLCALVLSIIEPSALYAGTSSAPAQPTLNFSQADTLGLAPETAIRLKQAIKTHDYVAAERLLIVAIERSPHAPTAGRQLEFLGGVYFLDHDAWDAAVAWNKAKAIAPLPPTLEFSLAMAYVRIGHPDWARRALQSLAAQNPSDALYPYWLGRLDYDADHYDDAVRHFQKAIQLAPDMAQAYNNLGLCYFRQHQNELAITNYQKAIELNRKSGRHAAWPHLNLAMTEKALDQPHKAEAQLREAIRIDPGLAPAHFQLGNVLEVSGQTRAAIHEFQTAVRLDPNYAQPHYELARIYRKLGNTTASEQEVKTYLQLRPRSKTSKTSQP